ncbi:hypothetical protein ACIP96_35240 [Streptomyces nigra]|uniref:hypothetical protein n=1 Tax=Streptomyces nigra TaxID=1827580 RepID=UPI00382BA347
MDARAAAQLAAQVLLTEPGLPDARVDAAHQQLLTMQADSVDPVVLAALRIAQAQAAAGSTPTSLCSAGSPTCPATTRHPLCASCR